MTVTDELRMGLLRHTASFSLALTLAGTMLPGCSTTRQATCIDASSSNPIEDRSQFITAWNTWADQNLQDADLVFLHGECYILMGTVNFSEFSTGLTDSRFSHVGMIAIEDGQAWMYDIRNKGCIRTRFGELMAEKAMHQLAIKRNPAMPPEARAQAAAFCRGVHERHEKFDSQFKLDNDRFYCAEMIEAAYRSVSYPLSEPVPICEFPNYSKHTQQIQFVRALTSIEPDQAVLLPGNDRIGIWANPELKMVLDMPQTKIYPPE